jgi:hypothetical protein
VLFNISFEPGWFLILLAGAACLAATIFLFDISLAALSTITGATMIALNVNIGDIQPTAIFFVLALFGTVAQFVFSRYGQPSPD